MKLIDLDNLNRALSDYNEKAKKTFAAKSHGTHLTIGTGASNAAAGNHTHKYAGSSSAGGAANNSEKFGGYSLWVGTQAQYDAISSKSSTTIYIIK